MCTEYITLCGGYTDENNINRCGQRVGATIVLCGLEGEEDHPPRGIEHQRFDNKFCRTHLPSCDMSPPLTPRWHQPNECHGFLGITLFAGLCILNMALIITLFTEELVITHLRLAKKVVCIKIPTPLSISSSRKTYVLFLPRYIYLSTSLYSTLLYSQGYIHSAYILFCQKLLATSIVKLKGYIWMTSMPLLKIHGNYLQDSLYA